jgi:hypothetical protein
MEDSKMWIKFADLCRKGGRVGLAHRTLANLLTEPNKDFSQLVAFLAIIFSLIVRRL